MKKHIKCVHNITQVNYYRSRTTQHFIVFIDEDTTDVYVWLTSTKTGAEFIPNEYYDIEAVCDKNNKLSYVKIIK